MIKKIFLVAGFNLSAMSIFGGGNGSPENQFNTLNIDNFNSYMYSGGGVGRRINDNTNEGNDSGGTGN